MVNRSRHQLIDSTGLGYWSIDYTFLVEVGSRDAKNLLSSNNLAFPIKGYAFIVKVWSKFDRELTVTYHTFIAQRLVNQSTPSSTGQGYFLAFLALEARNL